jgi:hypothetical protein
MAKYFNWVNDRLTLMDAPSVISGGSADAGKILSLNSAGCFDARSGRDWKYRRPVAEIYSDFIGGTAGWISTVSGTGASNAANDPLDLISSGIIAQQTGTTAAGRAALHSSLNAFSFGQYPAYFRAIKKFTVLPTVTEDWILRLGFLDNVGAESADAAYFRLNNSGNLIGVTRNNNSEVFTPTILAPALGTWCDLRIEVAANGSSVTFFAGALGGTPSIATLNNTLPTGINRSLGAGSYLQKVVGTTNRATFNDYMYAGMYLPNTLIL